MPLAQMICGGWGGFGVLVTSFLKCFCLVCFFFVGVLFFGASYRPAIYGVVFSMSLSLRHTHVNVHDFEYLYTICTSTRDIDIFRH